MTLVIEEMTESEIESSPAMIEAERDISRAHAVYLSAASAWHEALRRAAQQTEPDEATQRAVEATQAAYLEARDELEASRAEREQVRRRLYDERLRELKAHTLAEALARQDDVRRVKHAGERGLLSRLRRR